MNWIKQFSLENEVAVVTGAAGGLGQELVKILYDAGASLVLVDSNMTNLQLFSKEIDPLGQRVLALQCDVTKEQDIHSVIEKAHNHFQRIDVLVNCAGVLGSDNLLFDLTIAEWDRVFDVNLKGSWLAATHISQYMALHHIEGRIINISSSLGLRSQLKRVPYASSKAAVEHLTRNLAMELVQYHIRVNCLAPGWMNTPMVEEILNGPDSKKWRAAIPMGRAADPSELAGPLILLASKASSYMTGTILRVDGGYAYCGIELPE
jgi:NAD(P)-dependent dehydrogenase (short-subunit alcohol dehydrogenase family)